MDVITPLIILAIVVIVHFTFVNINIGLGVYSYILRWKSIKDRQYSKAAKITFKFLIATEIVSGVMGTMITVALAGFWPTLVNIATTILFIPLVVGLLGIAIRPPSIAGFWYTWDKTSTSIHMLIGLLMVIGGFMIPAGFRYIFALIDKPVGVTNLAPIEGNPMEALNNPVYFPLILHTWIGALSIGFFAAATGLLWAASSDQNLLKHAKIASLWAALLIIPQAIIGYWFWDTLARETPYLFRALSSSFLPIDRAMVDVSWSFLLMVTIAMYLLVTGILFYYRGENKIIGYSLAPLSIIALILGEFSHDYGRMPYMVITGDTGIEASLFVNKLVTLGLGEVLAGLIPIMMILITFLIFLYLYLVKGFIKTE